MTHPRRQRGIEIAEELAQMNARRRELLEERRILDGRRLRSSLSILWVIPIFEIIQKHPGATRSELFVRLGDKHFKFGDLTFCLTVLRRGGMIENRGKPRDDRWYSKEHPKLRSMT